MRNVPGHHLLQVCRRSEIKCLYHSVTIHVDYHRPGTSITHFRCILLSICYSPERLVQVRIQILAGFIVAEEHVQLPGAKIDKPNWKQVAIIAIEFT